MRKQFWLAIPLASMAFFAAGCSCATGDCAAPVDDCNTCVSSAQEFAVPAGEMAYEGGYMAAEHAPVYHSGPYGVASTVVGAGVHAVEGAVHGVGGAFQSVGHALGIASVEGSAVGGEVMTAEQYMALIQSGKVSDPGYAAPGASAAAVESTATMASIPSRFEFAVSPAVATSVSIEVESVSSPVIAAAPVPVAPMLSIASAAASFGEDTEEAFDAGMYDMSVISTEDTPISGDELSTPALMNAAVLREANIISSTVTADTGLVVPSGVQHIPSMPLPEGWGYIGEQDLGATGGGSVVETTLDEQYYSNAEGFTGVATGNKS